MRKIIPGRKLKSRVRLLASLLGIFLFTLGLCIGVFAYSAITGFRIISPLTHQGLVISSDQVQTKLQDMCRKANLSCQQIVMLPDGSAQITLTDGTIVMLSLRKDIEKQLASLQKVASQLTIKGRQLKKIDFRFDNVVVSF